ncbi:DUF2080 family transposase-associated protein [Methanocaldococcus sp.]
MKVQKETWKKPRNVRIALVGYIREHGNSAAFYPYIPKEYIGKRAILIIDSEEEEEFEKIKN